MTSDNSHFGPKHVGCFKQDIVLIKTTDMSAGSIISR